MIAVDSAKAAAVLEEAAVGIFAEMAFLDAQVTPAGAPEAGEVRVALDMLKPLTLRLELAVSRSLADQISELLYGVRDDGFASPGQSGESGMRGQDDSILEFLNVMAGNFITGYFGPGAPVKLELPFFVFGEPDEKGQEIARVNLSVEGLPAWTSVSSIRYRY